MKALLKIILCLLVCSFLVMAISVMVYNSLPVFLGAIVAIIVLVIAMILVSDKVIYLILIAVVSLSSCNQPHKYSGVEKLPVVNDYHDYKTGVKGWLLTDIRYGEAACNCKNYYYSKGDFNPVYPDGRGYY